MRYLLVFLLSSAGALALSAAIGALVKPGRDLRARAAAGALICVGIILLHLVYVHTGLWVHFPYPREIQVAFTYWLGPCLYLYFRTHFDPASDPSRGESALFVPGFCVLLAYVPYFLMSVPEKRVMEVLSVSVLDFSSFSVPEYADRKFLLIYAKALEFVVVGGVLGVAIHLLLILRRAARRDKPMARTTTLSLRLVTAAGVLGVPAQIMQSEVLFIIAVLFFVAFVYTMFIMRERTPHLFEIGKGDAGSAVHASRVKGVDLDWARARLHELMAEEKLYADEDLSLPRLADELDMSTHQISEILNRHLGKSFHQFVNEYRIAEARELLLLEKKRSVLSIATAVGFQSKSSFNAAFKAATGKTPREYRLDSQT